MDSIWVILIGAIGGMILTICVKSVRIQISQKYDLNFWDAIKVYCTKHTGPIVVGFIVIFLAMFIFPSIVANYQTDNGEYTAALQRVVKWLRPYSVLLGILAQGLGFVVVAGSESKYLRLQEEKKKGETQP